MYLSSPFPHLSSESTTGDPQNRGPCGSGQIPKLHLCCDNGWGWGVGKVYDSLTTDASFLTCLLPPFSIPVWLPELMERGREDVTTCSPPASSWSCLRLGENVQKASFQWAETLRMLHRSRAVYNFYSFHLVFSELPMETIRRVQMKHTL